MKKTMRLLATLCAAVMLLVMMAASVSAYNSTDYWQEQSTESQEDNDPYESYQEQANELREQHEQNASELREQYEQRASELREQYEQNVSRQNEMYQQSVSRQNEMYRQASHDVKDKIDVFTIFFWILFVVVGGLAIYIIVTMVYFSRTTMGKRELPPMQLTPNTVTAGAPASRFCARCGQEFGNANFCACCGTPRVSKSTYVLPIDGKISAQECEKMVNRWFAENPYVCNCTIKLETKQSLFNPFVFWKFKVKRAVIEYSVASQPQSQQYGLAFLYKLRVFGPIGYSSEKQVAKWLENNPGCQVVTTHGGHLQHWDSNGGFYAQYYNYVLFKK